MAEENDIHVGLPLHCMAQAPFLTVSELSTSIGVVRKTPLFRLDPHANERFGEATYLDAAYPQSSSASVYTQGMVEGFYLVSLMDALKKCTYQDDERYYGLNYGSNKLRFIETVLIGDVLFFQATIVRVDPRGEGFLVEVDCQIWVEGKARPAVVYSLIYLLLPVNGQPAGPLEDRMP